MCPNRTQKESRMIYNGGKKKGFDIASLMNVKSRRAAMQEDEVVQETENVFNIVMIDVDDLIPDKDNFYTTENIDELAAAIELSGCIEQNLVVKPEAHGKYKIIAGHRRRLAVLKLVQDGKEEYKKVPCRIKKESDEIMDKLSLILTNATARQLTDWEKIQQAEELKKVLTEYKKALQEENKDKPKEERERIGRIREIVAEMLNTSTTQIGRMEAISNNLSPDFKSELEKGSINISTAHELSRLDKREQEKAFEQYEKKGELHIKDVKPEEKVQKDKTTEAITKPQEPQETKSITQQNEAKPLSGQQNIKEGSESMPEPQQKKLDFNTWIVEKYGMTQYSMIQEKIKTIIALMSEREVEKSLYVWKN